jgi:hypothetical protein
MIWIANNGALDLIERSFIAFAVTRFVARGLYYAVDLAVTGLDAMLFSNKKYTLVLLLAALLTIVMSLQLLPFISLD